ncbi:peptidylprolyl isomerase [Pontiella agarivorans]|uniref:peptidylprolyl isomerase n=1 Tax=Pontiella agarivorans TaxID=3038953 RepID=A0ABU5N002_9BACT|nr:peptidyl-prolyl cis-trans isomerase [Pontiella agarivorans]MDZ8119749.1 peptidyl-prolyl cis-trans isomerase [Pontiella agarivorans]
MRSACKFLVIVALPLSAFSQFLPGAQPQPQQPVSIEIDGYAAKVNDRVITRGEVREAMAPALPEIYRQFQGPQLEEELQKAFNKAREEIIERVLIMEAFEERGGMIPDQYVNDEIKRVINDRFKGDKAMFEQQLAEQKKTREEYADMIREQMAVGMMTSEEVSRRARITPEQIREEYESHKETYFIPEKVKYSIIVLNKGTTPEDQAVKLEEAQKIRKKLIDGADFSETAKAVSEGSRAADGGAFPWLQPKDVREELREPLRSQPVGEISEIIETDTQLYILKVDARRQPGYKPFDEVRNDIKNILTAKERARLRARWIERLKANNYIVIYD